MAKGKIKSPMTNDLQAQPNHRMPSTAGTTEMMPDPRLKQTSKIQSPQTPFKINPNDGRKK